MSESFQEDRRWIVKPFAMEGLFDLVMQDVRLRVSVRRVTLLLHQNRQSSDEKVWA
jgi:hypothetical protein